ncbi:MAG: cadherin-like domain-containing protein [Rhizobiales bacterium]|nr:cadherin-like domain-containing protein [Hyphomicrobiales bacterium]
MSSTQEIIRKLLVGTDNDDVFRTGSAADEIRAGKGNDRIDSGNGDDLVLAGEGNDVVNAGNGNDVVFGGEGNDTIDGGNGDDRLLGEAGADVISGGNGNDEIDGGSDDDRLTGGNGNDLILGGAGADILDGGNGNDNLDGGAGSDNVSGGSGNDRLIFDHTSNAGGVDVYSGGSGNDSLVLRVSGETAASAAFQSQLAALTGQIAARGTGNGSFASLGLTVSSVESVTVEIVGGGSNGAPTGTPNAVLAPGTEDNVYTVLKSALLQGISDPDGDPLTITGLTVSGGGIVTDNGGSFSITMPPNFNGSVTLNYNVSDGRGHVLPASQAFTITSVNDGPTGPATGTLSDGTEDVARPITAAELLAGFSDVDGGTLSISTISATNGTITGDAASGYTFTPAANYNGPVTLSYTVIDGQGGSVDATRTFSLASVNDGPTGPATGTLADGTEDVARPIAAAELLAGFSDVDGGTLSISTISATNGTITGDAASGYTFTPAANYNGPVTLSYTVIDGQGGSVDATRTFSLASVNDGPTGPATGTLADGTEDIARGITAAELLAGFSDVDGGTLSISTISATNGTITGDAASGYTFTPAANYNGPVTLSYTVIDGQGGSVDATRTFSLASVNDGPTGPATGTLADGTEDIARGITAAELLAGFSDVDGGTLSISTISATNGTITGDAASGYTFTPAANYNGPVTLSYTVIDGQGGSVDATRTFSLASVNDAPEQLVFSADIVVEGANVVPADSEGAVIGVMSGVDPDGGALNYSVVNDTRFIVEGNVIRLAPGVSLSETAGPIAIEIAATDAGNASTNITVNLVVLSDVGGNAHDGYIAGATVFRDADNDGVLDSNEARTTTDADGNFRLFGGSGPLVLTGGTDISTGLAFAGIMRAPSGSTVVSPLTTLVAAVLDANPTTTLEAANSTVLSALGLPANIDLKSYDPIAASLSSDPAVSGAGAQAIAAAVQIQSTIVQASAVIDGASGAAATTAIIQNAVVGQLAAQIVGAGSNPIDLSNTALLSNVLTSAAQQVSTEVPAAAVNTSAVTAVVADVVQVIAAGNTFIDSAASTNSGTDLLLALAQAGAVAQNESTAALSNAGQTGNSGTIVSDFTGTNLENNINSQATGDVIGPNAGDTINGTAGADTLFGYGGNDTLNGLGANDLLDGGEGDDVLDGGDGNDTLIGGTGNDVIRTGNNIGGFGGVDNVNSGAGNDTIDFVGGTTGFFELRYDHALTGIDATIGNDTGTIVERGGIGTDTLQNLNVINGDIGGVQIFGTAQGDTFTINQTDVSDTVNVRAGGGNDTITNTGTGFVRADYRGATTGITVNLSLASGQVINDGFGGTDTLVGVTEIGGTFQTDSFIGSSGNDRFRPYGGNDTIDGGAGFDRVRYDRPEISGLNVNLTTGIVTGTFSGAAFTQTLTSIEYIRGSFGNDIIKGSIASERFDGRGGNDVFVYTGGNDVITDFQAGAASASQINVGAFGSINSFAALQAIASQVGANTVLTFSPGNTLTLNNVTLSTLNEGDFIFGNGGLLLNGTAVNDTLNGTPGNDVINGFDGSDTINAGDGDDVINAGSNVGGVTGFDNIRSGGGNDQISFISAGTGYFELIYDYAAQGIDVSINGASGTVTELGGIGTDTLLNLDQIDGNIGGLGITGSSMADTFTVSLSDATDFLQVRAGAGNDSIVNNGVGFVRADYRSSASGINVNLGLASGQVINDGFGNTDTLVNVQEISGSNHADTIIGSSGNDRFILNGGNDTVDGGAGFDRVRYDRPGFADLNVDLTTGVATGTWNGAQFTHTLASIEHIRGTSGNDTIRGSVASERFEGRGGNDLFVFNGGNDVISDFSAGPGLGDRIDLTDFPDVRNLANVMAIASQQGTDTVLSFSGGHSLTLSNIAMGSLTADDFIFSTVGQVINGTAGNDTLNGTAFDDTFNAGAGNDTINADAGNDFINPGDNAAGGFDNITSGSGNDTISFQDAVTGFFELRYNNHAINGINAVINGANGTVTEIGGIGVDTLTNLDKINGAIGGLSIVGTSQSDSFSVTASDTTDAFYVFAGGGNDTIALNGPGFLRADYRNAGAGITANLSLATGQVINDGFGGTDTLIGITELGGTNFADNITGSSGNDSFRTYGGNDTINGGAGFDRARYDRNEITGLNVNLSTGTATGSWSGAAFTHSLTSIEHVRGSFGNDIITGSAASERFDGRGGSDTFIYNGGLDVITDFVAGAASGSQINLAAFPTVIDFAALQAIASQQGANTVLTFSAGDTLTLNNVTLAALTADDFVFATGSNTINGTSGPDLLNGTAGADIINGFAGSDTINAGAGDDIINAGSNNSPGGEFDTIRTGSGNDTISFAGAGDGFFDVRYDDGLSPNGINATINDLTGTIVKNGGVGTDTLTDVGVINGNTGGLQIFGTATADTFVINQAQSSDFVAIRPGGGNDTITNNGVGFVRVEYREALGGVSINLSLASGQVINDGSGGTDTLVGVQEVGGSTGFADTIIGSSGNDRFRMFGGNDTVDGGAGFDRVRYDRSEFGNLVVNLTTGSAFGTYSNVAFTHTLTSIEHVRASFGNDILIGSTASENWEGRNGSDTFVYNGGTDVITDFSAGIGVGDVLNLSSLSGVSSANILTFGTQVGANAVFDFGSGNTVTLNNVTLANMVADDFSFTAPVYATPGDDDLSLTAGPDFFSAGAGNDIVRGLGNNDTIFGNTGNDTLFGDAGFDHLEGGPGNDTINGGSDTDAARFTANGGATARYSTSVVNDVISINLTENNITQTVFQLTRLPSGEWQVVDVRPGSPEGTDILATDVETMIAQIVGQPHNIQIPLQVQVSDPLLLGLTAHGTYLGDVLDAQALRPSLTTMDAATLNGGYGNDTLTGHAGWNFLNGGEGNDTLIGGGGLDFAQYSMTMSSTSTFSYSVVNSNLFRVNLVEQGGGTTPVFEMERLANGGWQVTDLRSGSPLGVDQLAPDIENIQFQGVHDPMSGPPPVGPMPFLQLAVQIDMSSSMPPSLYANGTLLDDTMNALSLAPMLTSMDYATLNGGNGNDLLVGHSGGERLDGGDGNDRLVAGAGGFDQLVGGNGNDTFVFNALPGFQYQILDFETTVGEDDTLEISTTALAGWQGNTGVVDPSRFAVTADAASFLGGPDVQLIFDNDGSNGGGGSLYFDSDGANTASGRTLLAVLESGGVIGGLSSDDIRIV